MRIAAPRSGGVHQPADLLLMRSACPPRCPLQSPGIPASKHTRRQVPRSRLPFRAAPTCNPHSACCQPVPNCPRLRALALFGRRPLQRVVSLVIPATKNLHTSGSGTEHIPMTPAKPYSPARLPSVLWAPELECLKPRSQNIRVRLISPAHCRFRKLAISTSSLAGFCRTTTALPFCNETSA
jgi:hypothetical protein